MCRALALLCALSVVLAGCAGSPSAVDATTTPTAETTTDSTTATTTRTTIPTPGPNDTVGFVEAEPVADVPANATVVNARNATIANVTPIQAAVREAVRTGSTATASFTRRENDAMSTAFDRLPVDD